MKNVELTMPEIALIGGTGALAGAGLALLLVDKIDPERRRLVGRAMFLFGEISTIPLAIDVLCKKR
jgi:hypothetical protein